MKHIIYIIRKGLLLLVNCFRRSVMIGDLKEVFRNNHSIENKACPGEKAWLKKWRALDRNVSPMSYRYYYNYLGADSNIVPPDTARQFIEPILNPGDSERFYNDKNSFGLFIDAEDMPKTLFRYIGDSLYDGEYNSVSPDNLNYHLSSVNQVIVKPAKELGGAGIVFFDRKGDVLVNKDNEPLSIELLKKMYKRDFLIQECFVQSDYIAQFNNTSINTIRLNTYRDIKSGEIHILGAVLRIGPKGSRVDNASLGGVFIGIDDNGKLGSCAFDKYGNKYTGYNDLDFSNSEFSIPNWDKVKAFAIKISKRVPHMRLFALDIVLDANNNPKLIEVNSNNFSVYFLQLTKQPVFGEFTDDIIEYCLENKQYLNIIASSTIRQ